MHIDFSQFYIEQGAEFPFSHLCMQYLEEEGSLAIVPSAKFIENYASDFDLIFRISARHSLYENEVRGPTVFRKDRDVEYSLFLPFAPIDNSANPPKTALGYLFDGVYTVFDLLDIDSTDLRTKQSSMVDHICSDPTMFRVSRHAGTGIGPPVWGEYIKQ